MGVQRTKARRHLGRAGEGRLEYQSERARLGAREAHMSHSDFFLKIDGIDGESHDAFHKGSLELESWNWGQSQPVSRSSGGSGAGKVQMETFFCTMKHCKASP